jgi:hypothetical protein
MMRQIREGKIRFDHPMQRKEGQWNEKQKSLLIHSMAAGFDIPPIYGVQCIENDFENFSVLDGKQRLTVVRDFINDKFTLSNSMKSVVIREGGVKKEYIIAGRKFSELDEIIQDIIEEYEFDITIFLLDCTKEEIEEQFYRLNNGASLTKGQKVKVTIGDELAAFIEKIEKSEFFEKKAYFSESQRLKEDVQLCILQTLMLVMDYPFKDFDGNTVLEFGEWFRENQKPSDLEYCEELFEKLNKAIPETEKPHKMMKKINIPIFAYHIQTIDELGISLERYGKWIQDFMDSYTSDSEYASYCGQGSTSKNKVWARVQYVDKRLHELEVHGE